MLFGERSKKTKNANEPMDQITIPSGLLAWLLLIPLRGQAPCQKQVVIGHRGRSAEKMIPL
jgi:hypothetical protein